MLQLSWFYIRKYLFNLWNKKDDIAMMFSNHKLLYLVALLTLNFFYFELCFNADKILL
jgi:hypothetical protein